MGRTTRNRRCCYIFSLGFGVLCQWSYTVCRWWVFNCFLKYMFNQPIRIAINGFGRIERCVLRAIYEQRLTHRIEVVHINEPAGIETIAHLTRFDSTHGVFPGRVDHDESHLYINGHPISVSHCAKPSEVNWQDLQLDMLFECSGAFVTRSELQEFIDAGCPR